MRGHSADTQATAPAMGRGIILTILGLLAAFPPLATDMYLSGFPQMAQWFGTDIGQIGATLSIFFLGVAIGQAVYGPVIDKYGRRIPLLTGITIYCVMTFGCLFARNLDVFIGLRFLQAVGGCAGMIVGRAIITDIFKGKEAAQALTLVILIMSLGPIIAPMIGGVIVSAFGWRMTFAAMLGIGLVCLYLAWRYLPETLPPALRSRERMSHVLTIYAKLLGHKAFLIPTLVSSLVLGSLFAFITGSPDIFMGHFHISETLYGAVFAIIAAGMIVAAQVNRVLLQRVSSEKMLRGALLLCCGAVLLLALSLPQDNIVLLAIPLWVAIAGVGSAAPSSATLAMAASGHHAGSASALVGVLQFCCAFLVSGIVAATQNGTLYPIAGGVCLPILAATALWLLAGRGSTP